MRPAGGRLLDNACRPAVDGAAVTRIAARLTPETPARRDRTMFVETKTATCSRRARPSSTIGSRNAVGEIDR